MWRTDSRRATRSLKRRRGASPTSGAPQRGRRRSGSPPTSIVKAKRSLGTWPKRWRSQRQIGAASPSARSRRGRSSNRSATREESTSTLSTPSRRVASLIASLATSSHHSSRAWLHRAPLLGACSRLPFALWWSVSARFAPSSHGTTAPLSWAFAQLRTQIWLSLRALLGRRGRTSKWSLRLPKPPLRALRVEWQSSRSATRARESSGPFRRSPPQHCSRRRDASMATVHASRCSSRRSCTKGLTLVVSAPV